ETGLAEEHEQRKAGDDPGQNQRKQDQATEESFARKMGTIQGQGRRNPEAERDRNGRNRHQQAVEDGCPDGIVAEQSAIPIQSEIVRRKSAYAGSVERIDDKSNDRQVQKRKYRESMPR